MNKHILPIAISLLLFSSSVISQRIQTEQINTNKFRQLNQEFSSPNMFRTASGAPGPAYYQQQADYKINIELDDLNKKIYVTTPLEIFNTNNKELSTTNLIQDKNQRSCITLAYLHLKVDSRKYIKRCKVLFDTGCSSSLIRRLRNQSCL